MALSEDYLAYVKDQLSGAGPVSMRKMFGGAGIYLDGVIFGLIAEDTLYLKVDDENRPDYEAQGMGPFMPFEKGSYAMCYYEVPAEVLEDRDELALWAGKSVEVSIRSLAKKKKKAGKKRPKKG
jgi:DNA transformation protein and related proteins